MSAVEGPQPASAGFVPGSHGRSARGFFGLFLTLLATAAFAAPRPREVNPPPRPDGDRAVAIAGARLVDGRGGPPVPEATVVVRAGHLRAAEVPREAGGRIVAVGSAASVRIPSGVDVVEARGLTLLPGFLDAHFHLDGDQGLPALFLRHGVTALRDPGAWIETYDEVRKATAPLPRLFLSGPHLDQPPPAYPEDARIVRDADETRRAVNEAADAGASVIKVYFRLPAGLIRVACETAHARGLPVTVHLEIVPADAAVRAGVDGIEHITSLGTALLPPREAEAYRQAVLADNKARGEGRYRMWSGIDLDSPRAGVLFRLMAERGTYLSPTLAAFERRPGDRNTTEMHLRAFRTVTKGRRRRPREAGGGAGGRPRSGQRRLSFLRPARRARLGLPTGAGTAGRGGPHAHGSDLRRHPGECPLLPLRGSPRRVPARRAIERGKLADLVLVEGDPLTDLSALRRVRRVMLNGRWVTGPDR